MINITKYIAASDNATFLFKMAEKYDWKDKYIFFYEHIRLQRLVKLLRWKEQNEINIKA